MPVKCIYAPSGLIACPFYGDGSVVIVVDSLHIVAPIFRGSSEFCSCFVIQYLCPSSFAIILLGNRESWLFYFNGLANVLWLLVLCDSSSSSRVMVCSV